MENIEKQRKVLSGNLEHDLNIECLMEEEDIHYSMKREQLEKLAEPVFKNIEDVMTKMKNVIA